LRLCFCSSSLSFRPRHCLQWRHSTLFTLQNSGDGEAAEEEGGGEGEGEGEGEREGHASVFALLLSLSGCASIYKRIGSSLTSSSTVSPRLEREAEEERIQQAKRTEERR